MASIDSGVDTGNDSNDSFVQDKNLVVKKETQVTSTSLQPFKENDDAHTKGYVIKCSTMDSNVFHHSYKYYENRYSPYGHHSTAFHFDNFFSHLHRGDLEHQNKFKLKGIGRCSRNVMVARKIALKNYLYCSKLNEVRNTLHTMSHKLLMNRKTLIDDCLRMAVFVNNTEGVKRYLEKGSNPNCVDHHYRTPLHISASNGYTEIVKLLLDHGADPNVKDLIGNTPLHLAVCTNHINVVTLLLNAGTNVSSYNTIGRSPLQLAQSKLKIIQRSGNPELRLEVTRQVIDMLMAFIKKSTKVSESTVDEELLNAFQSRLQVSDNQEQVENDLQNLLDNLSSLSISNSTSAALPSSSTAVTACTASATVVSS